MDFSVPSEHRILQDLVRRFVAEELVPLEPTVIAREASGRSSYLTDAERRRVDLRARELGLFALSAPESVGGANLPAAALIGLNEELGTTPVFYLFAPDSPNLRILLEEGTPAQREKYLGPLLRGEISTAIAISEPGAGSDPSLMRTRATRDGDHWVIAGRKLWISNAQDAAVIIVFAVTGTRVDGRPEVTAFLLDQGTLGMSVERQIPMLGGWLTYEVVFEDCVVSESALLGSVGGGWAPLQRRLDTRRLEIAAWSIGAARRALEMIVDYAPQRVTFGSPLSERQTVQWWIAEATTQLHAARLMCQHAAWKIDQGQNASIEVSMLKSFATELAWTTLDRAMQTFGALGVCKESPLYLMAEQMRTARIYEGPTEVHRWRTAREVLRGWHSMQ